MKIVKSYFGMMTKVKRCDIIKMIICKIILERTWQAMLFGVKSIHIGIRYGAVIFSKDNKHIKGTLYIS